MDCEKYEPLLLDELYEELDELTSAAVKRHVSGCARCASSLTGMRATRRATALPVLEVPEGLEERILAAAKEAQKVVPIRSRVSRVISRAGSWAMRPQSAMAAVFLLMIGSSAFLLREKREGSASAVSVEVAGAPAAQAEAEHDSLDDPSAAAAHGATPPAKAPPPPAATMAHNDLFLEEATGAGATREKKAKADETSLGGVLLADRDQPTKDGRSGTRSAAAGPANAAAPAGAPAPGDDYGAQQASAPIFAKRNGDPQDTFASGMAAYRARNFGEATRQFDAAATTGDQNAALWAARSTRDGSGCAVAVGRFDALAQRASGSWHGHEAELEAARCLIVLGQLDAAREKLARLSSVSTHASQAQAAMSELNQVASRRAAAKPGSGGGTAGRAAPTPAPKAPAPAAIEQRATDKAAGY